MLPFEWRAAPRRAASRAGPAGSFFPSPPGGPKMQEPCPSQRHGEHDPPQRRKNNCTPYARSTQAPCDILPDAFSPSVTALCVAMSADYLKRILTSKVYDVAVESPLESAPLLSQ